MSVLFHRLIGICARISRGAVRRVNAGAAVILVCTVVPAGAVDFSKPLEVICNTSAVQLDTNPFQSSQGEIRLKLQPVADGQEKSNKTAGGWVVGAVEDAHASSFAIAASKDCAPDCPVTLGNDGYQLWLPEPKALTQLNDDETLVLISLNAKTLELKASSFRKKQLAGLERGECKLVGAEVVPSPETSDKKAATDQPAETSVPDKGSAKPNSSEEAETKQ
ncbi:MAG: hypothetical protein RIC14_16780 [Filomicrobium sp.]